MRAMDWRTDTDAYTESVNSVFLIERPITNSIFEVRFAREDDSVTASIFRDGQTDFGRCECLSFHETTGPCAHLWGLKRRVEWPTVEDALTERKCPVCGSDLLEESA